MPKRKIERTLEKEQEFQQRREKKANNQHRRSIIKKAKEGLKTIDHRKNVTGIIHDNRIIELNEENFLNGHQQNISGRIRNNRVIGLNQEIINDIMNIILVL